MPRCEGVDFGVIFTCGERNAWWLQPHRCAIPAQRRSRLVDPPPPTAQPTAATARHSHGSTRITRLTGKSAPAVIFGTLLSPPRLAQSGVKYLRRR